MGVFGTFLGIRARLTAATLLSMCANSCGAKTPLRESSPPAPAVDEWPRGTRWDPGAPFIDAASIRDARSVVDIAETAVDDRSDVRGAPCREHEREDELVPDCRDPACASHARCQPCALRSERFELRSQPQPELWFAIDASQSMLDPTVVDGVRTISRWAALAAAARAALQEQNSLPMAAIVFPSTAVDTIEPPLCAVIRGLHIDPHRGANRAILRLIEETSPQGATPTGRALLEMERVARHVAPISRRFFVLTTDGEPNCGMDIDNVVQVLVRLRAELGIETFVLGIPGVPLLGETSIVPVINRLADAGGRPRDGATRFYAANNSMQIGSALDAIISVASGCSVQLSAGAVDGASMTVSLDGAPLERGRHWVYDRRVDRRTVYLQGSACEAVREGRGRSLVVTACGW
jgi:hypothetical protein